MTEHTAEERTTTAPRLFFPNNGLRKPGEPQKPKPAPEEAAKRAAVVLDENVRRIRESQAHAIAMIEANEEQFQFRFRTWLLENWHIWEAFCTEADVAWNAGRKRYGSRTIIEYLRHYSTKHQAYGAWSVNNDVVPDCGRLYGLVMPSRADFFECRVLGPQAARSRRRGVVAKVDDTPAKRVRKKPAVAGAESAL